MARARILGPRAARPLNGVWECASLAPGRATDPAELEREDPEWIACDGPMPAAAALRAAGLWDFDRPRDFDADDWWYRCRWSSSVTSDPARLRFEGLATIADVWLNGRHVLHSDNMFVAHTVDVADSLRDGDNELTLRFHALAPLLASKPRPPRPRWRTSLVANQALRWHRTSLLGRMPAWCPPVATVGPWRPVLLDTSPFSVTHARVDTRLDYANNRSTVDGADGLIDVHLRMLATANQPIDAVLTVGTSSVPLNCEPLTDNEYALTAAARLSHPDLWWPHTHGQQPLCDVQVSIGTGLAGTIDLGRVGFRRVEIDRGPDGSGFAVIVNGTPVFCRGACWTPLDLARLSADPATYRTALSQLRDAGMNIVRVSGTMAYETEVFHDLCDELGLLVWQDFMFANMDYPWADETFATNAALEVTQTLEALQSRPSLIVVCGNSEVEQQAAMLGLPASQRLNGAANERLTAIVHALAPDVAWLETTPTGGEFPFQVNSGISHYYGVGAYKRPLEDARRAGVRFAAECLAFSNVPEPSCAGALLSTGDGRADAYGRWKARVPRDPNAEWDFEDIRDHYLRELFGVSAAELRAQDVERYLALGRVVTGEAMLRTFAEWRRPGSTCRGGLVWFARDLWPGAGWGVVDAEGVEKAAYWYLKRACAPVALLSADEGLNGLWLHAVNDTARPIEADLRIALYRHGAMYGSAAHTALTIPARGSYSVHADRLFGAFLDLTYAYRFGPPAHDVVSSTLLERTTGDVLASASYFPGTVRTAYDDGIGLTARADAASDGYVLVLETERFAHAIAIDIQGFVPDDNYLDVEPGHPRRIGLKPSAPGAVPRGSVAALNDRRSIPIVTTEVANAR
jgi:beta-mannosidase